MEDFGFFNTDELVCELYQPKEKKQIPVVQYSPKIDDSHWFIKATPDISKLAAEASKGADPKERKKARKTKDNEDEDTKNERKDAKIVMRTYVFRIDHYYYKGMYKQALQDIDVVMAYVNSFGDSSSRSSLLDVQLRCHYQLADYQMTIEKIAAVEAISCGSDGIYKDSSVLHILAQCYHRSGRYQLAVPEYHRAISFNSVVWEWWMDLALAYLSVDPQPIAGDITGFEVGDQTAAVQKKNLDAKCRWSDRLKQALEHITKILETLDRTIIDIDATIASNTPTCCPFETLWIVQYKDQYTDEQDDDQLEEEDPYAM
eukprot:gene17275-20604_t